MNLYEFVETCQREELSAEEAEIEYHKAKAMEHARMIEEYENDPAVHEGWAQQDMIDMYRRER